jgi:hypothetical protein
MGMALRNPIRSRGEFLMLHRLGTGIAFSEAITHVKNRANHAEARHSDGFEGCGLPTPTSWLTNIQNCFGRVLIEGRV